MASSAALFANRHEAGVRLAREVDERLHGRTTRPLVLALPRGGAPVAVPVAEVLGAPLDVLVVRKVGAPGHEELAVGAVGPGGILVEVPSVVASLGIDRSQIEARAVSTEHERRRREKVFRGDRTFPAVAGRTVVVVDDGIATGATMRAALAALDAMGADDLWVAVPLAPPDTVAELRAEGRRVVCLETPASFFAVGQGYASFPQTSDQEVIDALRSHATARPAVGASAERRAAAARRAASGEAAHEPENVSTDV